MYGTWSKVLRVFAVALLLALPAMKFATVQAASSTTTVASASDPTQDTSTTDDSATDATTADTDAAPAPASRGPRMGAFGPIEEQKRVLKDDGAFSNWVGNMFKALGEIAHRPVFIVLYIVTVAALVVVRINFDDSIKLFGCGLAYIYSLVQTFALFKTNHYIVDYSTVGGPTTAKALWFAVLFTALFTWGVSRIVQAIVVVGMKNGLGAILGPLSPAKLLDKFRSEGAIAEGEDDGSAKNPKRQNTAIMFTDIVGYSAQMGKNEAAMVAKLNIHNEIMRNQIVRNRGTVIKTIGDAFMVRFRSAESAVMCALDCQKAIGEYNKGKTPDEQFHIRIGCHMGEVIHTGTDVFGEGVNIAARIEPKCDPDGVTVSDVIANAARNKIPAHFSSIGRHPMKNITNPPELFKVFPIEPQAAKGQKAAAAGAGAPGAAPGGTFKI